MSVESVAVLSGRQRSEIEHLFFTLNDEQRRIVSELVALAFTRGRCEATRRERQRTRQRETIATGEEWRRNSDGSPATE